ncbi:LysR family transcriptional regulator [Chromohalobacter israelensis]|uniref:Transcriptional regulator, LysR family n=1 Tax=Chromohalobacter israelensis (strain ATCC BAA-138 / DSM 3043 / CIP 106854 / NCIMB 13768 / 1H11) TaxID=290398 RepID=Q1QXN7_CHRI1|nr:LysR family transcriptional regulator [Chromohalobacter salexigens]ABE58771.1 transcriptional regulator, LysR family [Chromohalobacter salexigens DSM 3043]CDQ33134.1 Cyn operon transcriptional activator [Virgibacillus halodenitrificans]
MTFQQLTYFLAALDHGTLSKAAESLDLSQPSLSEQIIRLEESLGSPLFVRTNRRLRLTEAGRSFEPHARACLDAARQGQHSVQTYREMSGGVASFGTFGSAHHYFLNELITNFRTRYPDMRLRLQGYNSAEVACAVSEGELEAGLVMLPVEERNLKVGEPVWSARVGYISAESDHLKGYKDIRALAEAPLILTEARWHRGDPIRHQLNLRAQRAGVVLSPIIEVEHQVTGFELAARGLGDVIATQPILHHLGYQDRLGWVPLEPPLFEVFAFIQHRDTPLSPATHVLLGMMRKQLQSIQSRYSHLAS